MQQITDEDCDTVKKLETTDEMKKTVKFRVSSDDGLLWIILKSKGY